MRALWLAFWEGLMVGAMPLEAILPRLLRAALWATVVLLVGINLQIVGVVWLGEGLILAGSMGMCWASIDGWLAVFRATKRLK